MLAILIILLTGIIPTSNALAESNPPPTLFLKKGEIAPNDGYLVDESRLEKVLIAIKDLESTKNEMKYRIKYMEEKAKNDEMLFQQQFDAQSKENEATEKELKAEIARLDVWYKKPLFVAAATATIFILTGVLLP